MPDGKKLVWRSTKRAGYESDHFAIMVRDVASGQTRELAPTWDRSAQRMRFSRDGRALFVSAEDLGQTRIFRIDLYNGNVKSLTGEGHVTGFDVGAGGIVYVSDSVDAPGQLYHLPFDAHGPRLLTRLNSDKLAMIAAGRYEQFEFPGWNNERVYAYLVKPAEYRPAEKYPVVMLIHGGPQASYGNLFHYRANAEVLAHAGYAVLVIDFHGSTGYGQAFTDSVSGNWGKGPLEDLQKGLQFALHRYEFLDGDRACLVGGSFGGYLANWIAGKWNMPWRCAVVHAGVFDTRSWAYSTAELWFPQWEFGGMPWQAAENYERFNPALHVAQWRVPTLVTHGGQDFAVPLDQGIAAFTALQHRGVPSELLYFPDEGHLIVKPQNSAQWYEAVIRWLDKWTAPQASIQR